MATDYIAVTCVFDPGEGQPFQSFHDIPPDVYNGEDFESYRSRHGFVEGGIGNLAKVFQVDGLDWFGAECAVLDTEKMTLGVERISHLLSLAAAQPQQVASAIGLRLTDEEIGEAVTMQMATLQDRMDPDGDDLFSLVYRLKAYRGWFRTALERGHHVITLDGC